MYEINDGKAIPNKAEDMEWLLRYGDVNEIIKHRYYIAHIVSLYLSYKRREEGE